MPRKVKRSADGARICANCDKVINPQKRVDAIFCSDRCRYLSFMKAKVKT